MKRFMGVMVLVLLPIPGGCQGSVLDNSVWGSAAKVAGLDVSTFYGIAVQESGMRWADGSFRPWPWTLSLNEGSRRVKKGPRHYASKAAAVAALRGFVRDGITNIDVGLMQVNLRWHGHRVHYDLNVLLEPTANIMAAASYLGEIEANSSQEKLSAYHAPKKPVRGNAYANRVNHFSRIIHAKIR